MWRDAVIACYLTLIICASTNHYQDLDYNHVLAELYWEKIRQLVIIPLVKTHCGLVTSYGDVNLGQHCRQATSHYLNQCWLIINKVQWHPSESNFTGDTSACSNILGANELTNIITRYHLFNTSHRDFLTHWGRVTHTCVSKLTIIASDHGLSPGWRQAIFWTNAGILLIRHLGTNFSDILIEIQTFSLKKMHLKMSSGKWRPFCFGLNVLKLLNWIQVLNKHSYLMQALHSIYNRCWWCPLRSIMKPTN